MVPTTFNSVATASKRVQLFLVADLVLVQWLEWIAPPAPYVFNAPGTLLVPRFVAGELFRALSATLFLGLLLLLFFLLLRIIFRKQWLTILVLFVVQSTAFQLGFTIAGGEVLALVGESGCGKSMTALSLMRLVPRPGRVEPAGRLRFEGRDLLALSVPEMRQVRGGRMAMIFQDPMSGLNPVRPVGHQVVEAIRLHRRVSRRAAFSSGTQNHARKSKIPPSRGKQSRKAARSFTVARSRPP